MSASQASEQVAKPDYTKVRGWLLAFGIYAGWQLLSDVFVGIFFYEGRSDLASRLPEAAALFYRGSLYAGYVLFLLTLLQCVCIFRRRRLGRQVSLLIFAGKFLIGLASFPFLSAACDAYVVGHAPKGVDPAAYAQLIHGILKVYAYVDAFLGLAIAVAGFLYFWRSERVKQTLVD